ncbi:MAG: GLPGLI family protein [Flavobacteriaceae bacterium]|nr:GLPGLI family protein [Flavobacteriaceae bacterium]
MKTKLIYLLLVTTFSVNAQNISGKAYYQSKTILDFDMSKTEGMDENMKKIIAEKLKKRMEKSYVLIFNSNESIYREEEKVGIGKKNEMMYVGSVNSGALYINIKNNQLIEEREIFEKPFLINDHIPKLDWELEKESKQIGQYVAFKATATKKINVNDKKTNGTEAKNKLGETEVLKEIIITAWYTPQIPVSKGPGEYVGLPGLILELNVHRTTILCYKIILTEDIKEIKPPTRGERVTRKEYNKILKAKMEEMQGNFIEGESSSGMRIKN